MKGFQKNSLPYLKCVLRLSCVVHGPIYGRFNPEAAQAHYVWVRASEVIWSEYTRIISVLSDA